MAAGESGKKVGAIIQARYDSQRFPGKVLMPLPFHSSKAVIQHIYDKAISVKSIHKVIIATSDETSDNVIQEYCASNNMLCSRGSKNNVLERFVLSSELHDLDIVVRMTGDNPVVLVDILDMAIKKHVEAGVDYTRNLNMPYGTSFEIVNVDVLKNILHSNSITDSDKEHVTIFIKQNKSDFKIQELEHNLSPIDFRFTIDYPSDFAAMNLLFTYLDSLGYKYQYSDLYYYLTENKWITSINNQNYQKIQHKSPELEIASALQILRRLGFEPDSYVMKKLNS